MELNRRLEIIEERIKDMEIQLNVMKKYVIVNRNKDLSEFGVIDKYEFDKSKEDQNYTVIKEEKILSDMELRIRYYTYNKRDNLFTEVIKDPIHHGHIKTEDNDNEEDNLGSLPVM